MLLCYVVVGFCVSVLFFESSFYRTNSNYSFYVSIVDQRILYPLSFGGGSCRGCGMWVSKGGVGCEGCLECGMIGHMVGVVSPNSCFQ